MKKTFWTLCLLVFGAMGYGIVTPVLTPSSASAQNTGVIRIHRVNQPSSGEMPSTVRGLSGEIVGFSCMATGGNNSACYFAVRE